MIRVHGGWAVAGPRWRGPHGQLEAVAATAATSWPQKQLQALQLVQGGATPQRPRILRHTNAARAASRGKKKQRSTQPEPRAAAAGGRKGAALTDKGEKNICALPRSGA